jgi:hypothetical protein
MATGFTNRATGLVELLSDERLGRAGRVYRSPVK